MELYLVLCWVWCLVVGHRKEETDEEMVIPLDGRYCGRMIRVVRCGRCEDVLDVLDVVEVTR